jgi:hypothetical protein
MTNFAKNDLIDQWLVMELILLKPLKGKQLTCHLEELLHNVTTSQALIPCV